MTTNTVTRFLDAKQIPYTAYELPAEKLGALETASILNVPAQVVFKTIVILRQGQGKPILAIVPGTGEVDLKALAKFTGEKKLTPATQREAERITGLQSGGISPLALLNKGFRIILDQSATHHTEIHISAGQRGLNVRLQVKDFLDVTHARLAEICTPAAELRENRTK